MAEERSPLKNDVYATDNFDWTKWKNDDMEWNVQMKMNIKEVRMLYSMISFYLHNYSGAPGRPPEEDSYLPFPQQELYKMLQDYNLTHNKV